MGVFGGVEPVVELTTEFVRVEAPFVFGLSNSLFLSFEFRHACFAILVANFHSNLAL